ncbi:hypothetical protein EV702DRAFT_1197567 [Suillus placidus]|uniref:Uncharacterized protein n=1 Tax=Suillus placidus TaxID=48579 RepID=A0A9P7D3L8_9AGAM|nr:hypothetical protein EV702DRAFT_1197567 [Suillus placidus]
MPSKNASNPRLIVIHSFDVNKPGAEADDLKGGILGGSIPTTRAGARDPDEKRLRPPPLQAHFQRDHLSARGEQSLASGRRVGRVLGAIELENSLFLLHRLLGVRTEDKKHIKSRNL